MHMAMRKYEDRLAEPARMILNKGRAVDPTERRSAYEAEGWTHFDPAAPVLPADQIQDVHSRSVM
jgi:hypothetical protein